MSRMALYLLGQPRLERRVIARAVHGLLRIRREAGHHGRNRRTCDESTHHPTLCRYAGRSADQVPSIAPARGRQ